MPSTILNSAVFRDIFTTAAMRARVVGRKPRAEISRLRGGAGARARQARHHPEKRRRRDRAPLRRRQDRHGQAEGSDRADRLSGAAGGAAAGQAVQGRARRVVALGRHHPGHHRHRHRAADPRGARYRRRRHRRHCRCAGQARQEIPRHADGRAQQPAAGGADHLRLQDGDPARRLRAPQAAPEGASPARAGRRIRRRRRHAVLARQGRAEGAGRALQGAQARPARDFLAHGARHASPRSAASSAWSPAPAARSPST